jgi:hypothetical protein
MIADPDYERNKSPTISLASGAASFTISGSTFSVKGCVPGPAPVTVLTCPADFDKLAVSGASQHYSIHYHKSSGAGNDNRYYMLFLSVF